MKMLTDLVLFLLFCWPAMVFALFFYIEPSLMGKMYFLGVGFYFEMFYMMAFLKFCCKSGNKES